MSELSQNKKYVIIQNLIVFSATSICVASLAFGDKDISPLWGFICLVGLHYIKDKEDN